jgi:hypothetical protein
MANISAGLRDGRDVNPARADVRAPLVLQPAQHLGPNGSRPKPAAVNGAHTGKKVFRINSAAKNLLESHPCTHWELRDNLLAT